MAQSMMNEGVKELIIMEWEDCIVEENDKVVANEIVEEVKADSEVLKDEEDDDFWSKIPKPSKEIQTITAKLFKGINNEDKEIVEEGKAEDDNDREVEIEKEIEEIKQLHN